MVSPNALVALPGGGQVSVAFLASRGVPGYTVNNDGTASAPSDATFTGEYAVQTPSSNQTSNQPGAQQNQKDQNQNQQSNQDAAAIIRNELTAWGFDQTAADWAWNELVSGKSPDQVLYDFRQTDFYKNSIFGQINQARLAANKPVMSEQQILDYKNSALNIQQQAGLPTGFLTDSRIAQLAAGDVSIAELDKRVNTNYVAAAQALPAVRDTLASYYGIPADQITTGALAAYYLDPEHALPLLDRQFKAASIGAQGQITGYGPVDRQTAEQLAAQGVSQEQAQAGFSDLGRYRQLYTALPGSNPLVDQQTALSAEFNKDAASLQRMQLAQDTAKAPFAAAQKFAETQSGTGAGQALSA